MNFGYILLVLGCLSFLIGAFGLARKATGFFARIDWTALGLFFLTIGAVIAGASALNNLVPASEPTVQTAD